MKRILAGIRATGRLHLGNYLGAVKGMLALQADPSYETLYMVADLHAITTPYKIEDLQINRREVVMDYLAAGLDPKKSVLFLQSQVPEHAELAFYFSSVSSIARMQHIPTFKEKVRLHPQDATMALLNYPILMAADILAYKAGLVPAGIDQEPHIEFAREVAKKMNQQYGMDFPEPIRFATQGQYVPSLKGQGKMAKSVEGSFITLHDAKEVVQKKVRSIPTVTTTGGAMDKSLETLFTFAHLFMPEEEEGFKKKFSEGTLKFVEMKDAIAEAISHELKPLQEKRKELAKDRVYVDQVILEGAERAQRIASKTVSEVKEKMGLG